MPKHFICTGTCWTKPSSTPGFCNEEGCPKQGDRLVECDCEDGWHRVLRPPGKDQPKPDKK